MLNSRLKLTFMAAALASGTLLTANVPASADVRSNTYNGVYSYGAHSGGADLTVAVRSRRDDSHRAISRKRNESMRYKEPEYYGGRHDRWYGWNREYRWNGYNRCTPGKALRKARKRGLRRAHIVRINRRGIIVKGRKWGDRVTIGFDRRRGCKIRFVKARQVR